MAFLFRLHLVDLDPKDEAQIQKKWKWILEAIKYSSPSLYQEVFQVPFESLKKDLKHKIIKYLIRGRYRSTPFGLWAGVGQGQWNDRHYLETPITYSRIPGNKKANFKKIKASLQPYKLAPGIIEYSDQVHYWSYCKQEEGWRISYLDKNQIVKPLLAYFKKSELLDKKTFESFFEVKNQPKISKIWNMILESGILIPSDFPACHTRAKSIDIRIKSRLFLANSIQEKMDRLISEIGNLLVAVESEFLVEFKKWFQFHYDDRFVPLALISPVFDFVLGPDHSKPEVRHDGNTTGFWSLFRDSEEIDLANHYSSKQVGVRHLQIVFKLFGTEEICIENIVCNREFAYAGRFSLDPELKEIITGQLPNYRPDAELVDVILFESSHANSICRHSNAFQFSIYPFGTSIEKNHLGTEDLLLGMREGKLILFSKRLGKPVIPVIQHPLNPNQITHTLSRLFWELGNQEQFRFLPYHLEAAQKNAYVPRLTWKGIILQGRRWMVERKHYPSKTEFLNFLMELKIPVPILAGHLDRELVLDWTDPIQLDFLWKELNRGDELCLTECPWVNQSSFTNQNGEALYPQIIYAKPCNTWEIRNPGFLNRITESNLDWVYARIFVNEIGMQPLLFKSLPNLIGHLISGFQISKWYYLIYQSPKTEIRLRILPLEPQEKSEIAKLVQESLCNSGWIDRILMDTYYPEFEKYGSKSGKISDSESIFHRESEMILGIKIPEKINSLLCLSEEERIDWVISRFYTLMEITGHHQDFFGYFRNWVKQIPVEDRKLLNQKTTEGNWHFQKDTLLEQLDLQLIKGKKIEDLLRILPNHIHLCCNRLFPLDSEIQERRVIYGIYKKLGEAIYRLTRIINVFSNRSL